MFRVKVNNKKYMVPNRFSELLIKHYQDLNRIDTTDELDKMMEYLRIITQIDLKTLKQVRVNDLKKLYETLMDLFENDETRLVKAVKIGKRVYMFDNLDDMRFDMFLDLEEMTKNEDDIINNIHLIMAMLYRPVTNYKWWNRLLNKKLKIEEYNADDVKDRAEFFQKNMYMDKVLGALFFFINLKMKYIQNTADSLKAEIKAKMKKDTKI